MSRQERFERQMREAQAYRQISRELDRVSWALGIAAVCTGLSAFFRILSWVL